MAPRRQEDLTRRSALGRLCSLVLAGLVTLCAPASAAAQPVAMPWPQFQGDAAHLGSRADAPPPPYAAAWTASPDASAGARLSPPVVGGGVVVTSSADAVYAFEESDGTERWHVARDGPPTAPAVATAGGADAVVYTDGRDPDTSKVAALDVRTGEPVWDAPASLRAESRSGVTVDGGRAFVGDENGNVYAVDLSDGSIAWTKPAGGDVAGPIAVGDGIVVAVVGAGDTSSSASVVAFDVATGERRWAVTPDATASFGSLASVTDGSVIVAFPDGSVAGLSTKDGSETWRERIQGLVSPFVSPAVVDGSVIVADSNGGVHRLTPGGGETWLFEFNATVLRASPVVGGDVVVVGFEDGSVAAVALDSGHMTFRSAAAAAPVSGVALTPKAVVVTRSGAGPPEVAAYANDPDGTLVDVVSPTVPVASDLALGFVLALVVGLVILVPGRLLARRTPIEDPSATADDEAAEEAAGDEPEERS